MPIPAIAAALFSKGLSILGEAVLTKGQDFVEEKLGVKLDEKEISDNALKYKQLEIDHEELLLEAAKTKKAQELEEIKLENENTEGARIMNLGIQESEHASPLAKNAAYVLDFIIVGATLTMMIIMFFKGVPQENKEFFYMALGSLLTMCVTVINFHRGSSSRSAAKDATIQALSGGPK